MSSTRRAGRRSVATLVLFVVALGCTGPGAPQAHRGGDPPTEGLDRGSAAGGGAPTAEAELPGRAEFVENALQLRPESRGQLAERLGSPDAMWVEEVANRHVPGVKDSLFTVRHGAFLARFHQPGGGGDLLSMVQVSSNRHLRYAVIGLSVTRIDAAFGPPDEASDTSLTYYCTSCVAGDDPVELIVDQGQVQRVRFNYYVD